MFSPLHHRIALCTVAAAIMAHNTPADPAD
jgi:hypothetical protein